MTETPNYHLKQWEPEDKVLRTDFNADNLALETALDALDKKDVKIETGSYVGTGTSGYTHPNSLTFSVTPKIVIISRHVENQAAISSCVAIFFCNVLTNEFVGYGYISIINDVIRIQTYNKAKLAGKTLSWYYEYSSTPDQQQYNENKITYKYLAIG